MRKLSIRFLAFFLSVFLCFSVVSSRYFYTRARAMDPGTAAGLIVAGGGVATGGALIPFVAIATIVALAGYEINAYISDAARANGQTKTEYISDLFHEYCNAQSETGEAVATTIATGATVTRNGIINIVGAGAAKLKGFLNYIMGNEKIEDESTDISPLLGTFTGEIPLDDDGKYVYSGSAIIDYKRYSGSNYQNLLNTYKINLGLTSNPTSNFWTRRIALLDTTTSGATAITYKMYSLNNGSLVEYSGFYSTTTPVGASDDYNNKWISKISIGYNTDTMGTSKYKYIWAIDNYSFNYPIFKDRNDLINYLTYGTFNDNEVINYSKYGGAFIGDWVNMTHAQSYLNMDDLTNNDAYILNPGVLGGLEIPDVSSDIPIGIGTYVDVIGQVIDKPIGGVIEFPTDVASDIPSIINPGLPTVAPPVISIPDAGDDVISIPDNPSIPDDPVIDIPSTNVAGLVDEMNPVFQWGLSYISPQKGILSKFPFSIAYDLYLLIASLSGESQDAIFADPNNLTLTNDLSPPTSSYSSYTSALVWDLNFNIPVNGSNISFPIHIDLSQFEWFFRVIRVGVGVVWLIGLFNWARKEVN